MSRGRMTPVVANLLRSWRAEHGGENETDSDATSKLRQFFWQKEITSVVRTIKLHLEKAKVALARIEEIENPEALLSLVNRLDDATEKILVERNEALEFLRAYEVPTAPANVA